MPTLTADTFTLCAILDGFDPQRDTQMKLVLACVLTYGLHMLLQNEDDNIAPINLMFQLPLWFNSMKSEFCSTEEQ